MLPLYGEDAMKNASSALHPNPAGDIPQVDPTAYVAPTAQIIGRIRIGPGTFVGPVAVLRADEADADGRVHPILIGPDSNVQDGNTRTALYARCCHGQCGVDRRL
jgi:carbonic anhydrase/acetyltransferase-like protein (isoleucine patch superfamily)